MGMMDYLEQDREQLQESLRQAGTGEKAAQVLQKEMDHLLLRYNEQCEFPPEREAAAFMVQTLQTAFPLLDTVGETRVWERSDVPAGTSKGKPDWKTGALLGASAVCFLLTAAFAAGHMESGAFSQIPLMLVLMTAGALCAFFGGRSFGKPKKESAGKNQQQVEVRMDGGKIYRQLRTALTGIDQNLQALRRDEDRERDAASEERALEADPAEWDLLAGFLEASYSRDGEYALEQCENIRYYLHRKGIELVDYSEDVRAMFDVLPSKNNATIRPALTAGGKLLKKGLAAGTGV